MDRSVIRQGRKSFGVDGYSLSQMRLCSGNELLYEPGAGEEPTAVMFVPIMAAGCPGGTYAGYFLWGFYGAVQEIFWSCHIPVIAHVVRFLLVFVEP